jgi:hypothetical protein
MNKKILILILLILIIGLLYFFSLGPGLRVDNNVNIESVDELNDIENNLSANEVAIQELSNKEKELKKYTYNFYYAGEYVDHPEYAGDYFTNITLKEYGENYKLMADENRVVTFPKDDLENALKEIKLNKNKEYYKLTADSDVIILTEAPEFLKEAINAEYEHNDDKYFYKHLKNTFTSENGENYEFYLTTLENYKINKDVSLEEWFTLVKFNDENKLYGLLCFYEAAGQSYGKYNPRVFKLTEKNVVNVKFSPEFKVVAIEYLDIPGGMMKKDITIEELYNGNIEWEEKDIINKEDWDVNDLIGTRQFIIDEIKIENGMLEFIEDDM